MVANAIRYAGAAPVYVDCSPDNWNMDIRQAEGLITPKSKVLIIQHTFGIPNNMDDVLAVADISDPKGPIIHSPDDRNSYFP